MSIQILGVSKARHKENQKRLDVNCRGEKRTQADRKRLPSNEDILKASAPPLKQFEIRKDNPRIRTM